MVRFVYSFDEIREPVSEETVLRLGNKGAQLAEMTRIGLPVPPGFTITTQACREFYARNKKWPEGIREEIRENMRRLETRIGKKFGDPQNPLLVSVRSGSYVSMPGMMDTVLNLGLNDETLKGLGAQVGSVRGALDSYRRFIQMFGDVVLGIPNAKFEEILSRRKNAAGVKQDTELKEKDLEAVIAEYQKMVQGHTGREFPQDPQEQLQQAINAVFDSWNIPRAVSYRRIHKLREDAGTGVNVQAMVFGNLGNGSGTGVGFTRNPSTGEKEHYGEFLLNAQGEDVVAGIRTPQPIDSLKQAIPEAYAELMNVYRILETHYRDMQDFEFTIERKKLFLLQTRNGKRTAQAAIRIAIDMVKEGLISKTEALMRVSPKQVDSLLHKQIDPRAKSKQKPIALGLAASPGAAVGKAVFTAEKARKMAEENPQEKLILVRSETSPEDIEGMHAAKGILTSTGGLTSHAAVVARGMGKPCVSGAASIQVNEEKGFFTVGEHRIEEGEMVSIDGTTGEVFDGEMPLVSPQIGNEFLELMKWTDEFRTLGVRANADTPQDAKVARGFGARGIGLCRTEHMFFEETRIAAVREMILSSTQEERERALAKILPFQRTDFEEIFEVMEGLPVTIRLLDPPLHEFLPKEEAEIRKLAQTMRLTEEKVMARVQALHEFNPMLGFRGCRLGIVYPEINQMQVRAIIEAALNLKKKGIRAVPEIMIPVLGHVNEMKFLRQLVDDTAQAVMKEKHDGIEYTVGVMMELPRACLTADEIAHYADFFSFGTNDLTQTTFGYSRDDSGIFVPVYLEKGILSVDPFESVDPAGVGALIRISAEKGRSSSPKIKLGICGEHGGDPASIEFFESAGLHYVSCSPYRVPIARLAAAQAAIKKAKG
ncbi:MAG: pyruvate, phosphate dikinase [Candidatus Diapherotrites archaeon]|nr:pyruvate, phosphate dikinase [Candidatus Diapherotrites archaeon]